MTGANKIVWLDMTREHTPYQHHGDDELMQLAQKGKTKAFSTLMARHQGMAFRMARKYVRHPHQAKDVVQNTFVALYGCLPRYKAQGRFMPFFYRLLVNECRKELRSNRYRKLFEGKLRLIPAAAKDMPDEWVIAKEQKRQVDETLMNMGDKLKQVVILKFVGELSYAEIAETLKIPIGTVRSRLSAAMVKIRKALEDEDIP